MLSYITTYGLMFFYYSLFFLAITTGHKSRGGQLKDILAGKVGIILCGSSIYYQSAWPIILIHLSLALNHEVFLLINNKTLIKNHDHENFNYRRYRVYWL